MRQAFEHCASVARQKGFVKKFIDSRLFPRDSLSSRTIVRSKHGTKGRKGEVNGKNGTSVMDRRSAGFFLFPGHFFFVAPSLHGGTTGGNWTRKYEKLEIGLPAGSLPPPFPSPVTVAIVKMTRP